MIPYNLKKGIIMDYLALKIPADIKQKITAPHKKPWFKSTGLPRRRKTPTNTSANATPVTMFDPAV